MSSQSAEDTAVKTALVVQLLNELLDDLKDTSYYRGQTKVHARNLWNQMNRDYKETIERIFSLDAEASQMYSEQIEEAIKNLAKMEPLQIHDLNRCAYGIVNDKTHVKIFHNDESEQ